MGVSLSDRMDQLVWITNKVTSNVTAKLAYNQIMENIAKSVGRWWNTWVWKATGTLKINLFGFLCLNYRIFPWDVLQKKRFVGPNHCFLCRKAAESVDHLFGRCIFFIMVIMAIGKYYNI